MSTQPSYSSTNVTLYFTINIHKRKKNMGAIVVKLLSVMGVLVSNSSNISFSHSHAWLCSKQCKNIRIFPTIPQPEPQHVRESSLPPPPPEMLQQPQPQPQATPMNGALTGSDQSLNSLPPPPEELKFPLRYQAQVSNCLLLLLLENTVQISNQMVSWT